MKRKPIAILPPATPFLVGYARVSTREQNLDLQIDALRRAGVKEDNLHVEKVSANSRKRPALDDAIRDLRPGDMLVVWRLDRLARSMKELYERLDAIKAEGASFKSLMEQFDFTTATGQLILGFLGLMAQFERQLTVERTRAGIKSLRDKGLPYGRKPKMTQALKDRAFAMLTNEGQPAQLVADELGVSVSLIYTYFKFHKDGTIEVRK
jgi:DNA invertase Pin-like site-specific DNA recombinase